MISAFGNLTLEKKGVCLEFLFNMMLFKPKNFQKKVVWPSCYLLNSQSGVRRIGDPEPPSELRAILLLTTWDESIH